MDKSVRIAVIIVAIGIALSLIIGVSFWGIALISSTFGISAVHSIILEVMYFSFMVLICVGVYRVIRVIW